MFGGNGRDVSSEFSHLDGVTMVRSGTWGRDESARRSPSSPDADDQRGLLSVAVEFLFGPDDTESPGSQILEADKWKLRAAILVRLSEENESEGANRKGVSLRELLPFVDNPPASVEDASATSEALRIVAHFNGRPIAIENGKGGSPSSPSQGIEARFHFPELMAETEDGGTRQKILGSDFSSLSSPAEGGTVVRSVLCDNDMGAEVGRMLVLGSDGDDVDRNPPTHLYERPFVLTRLSQRQFGQCVLLGAMNFLGVLWVRGTVSPGGLLELPVATAAATTKRASRRRRGEGMGDILVVLAPFILGLLKVLNFYAVLFFLLPVFRLVILAVRNKFVDGRNRRRASFVRTEL